MAISSFGSAKSGYKPPANKKPKKRLEDYGNQKPLSRNPSPLPPPAFKDTERGARTGGGVGVSNGQSRTASQDALQGSRQRVGPSGISASVSSGGSGGSGGVNTTPVTGSIAGYGYTPEAMAAIYNQPTILTTDLLAKAGITNPSLAQTLAEYMDPAMVAYLMNTSNDLNATTDPRTLSYVNDYMQDRITPNAQTPDAQAMFDVLLGATDSTDKRLGTYFSTNQETGLAMSPEEQADMVNAYMQRMLVDQNPYAQRMWQGAANQTGLEYQDAIARTGMKGYGDPGENYIDYLGGSALGKWMRR